MSQIAASGVVVIVGGEQRDPMHPSAFIPAFSAALAQLAEQRFCKA
jgi:hypothetical protein